MIQHIEIRMGRQTWRLKYLFRLRICNLNPLLLPSNDSKNGLNIYPFFHCFHCFCICQLSFSLIKMMIKLVIIAQLFIKVSFPAAEDWKSFQSCFVLMSIYDSYPPSAITWNVVGYGYYNLNVKILGNLPVSYYNDFLFCFSVQGKK